MRTVRLVFFALFVAGTAGAAPISNLTFTVIPLGDPPSHTVTAIAADPGGSRVWFTDQNFSQIGFIELATGAVTKYSVRPPGGEAVFTIASSQALIFGPDGNLWFPAVFNLNSAPAAMLGRFAPGTGTLTYFPLPGNPFITLTHLAAGPDGNVWFTHQSESKLGRVTPAGAVSSISIATANGSFAQNMKGLTFGAEGNAWVTSGARSIFSVPTSGATATEYRLQGGSFRTPSAITRGPDNNLYFIQTGTSADLGNRIGRITSSGAITEWEIPTANSAPAALAFGSDGKVYFTEQSAKQLGQLDPATGAIFESPVPNRDTPLWIVGLPSTASSPVKSSRVNANGPKSGVVFTALPSSLRDPYPIWAVIDPGDGRPDPAAWVSVIDNILFGRDPDELFETFRVGGTFFLLLTAENVSATAPTFGPITMKSRVPGFVKQATAGFVTRPGTCKEEGGLVACTTPATLASGEAVTAVVTFGVPRPPPGAERLSFEISNSISGGGDVNENNNFIGRIVQFLVDRDGGVLRKLPDFGLAVRSGRR